MSSIQWGLPVGHARSTRRAYRALLALGGALWLACLAPALAGANTAPADVEAGAAGTKTVRLGGTGEAASYTLSTTSLAFGMEAVNVFTAAQSVTLTNTAAVALPLTSITLTGANPAQFSKSSTCGASVASGATCTVSVRFMPTAVGAKAATLTFKSTAAAPQGVSLSGTGERAIITHHNDTERTGWNATETTLTPGAVSGGTFGLLHQVKLDDQVDAEPLYVSGLAIAGGSYNVVIVATENNSVYAINAASGAILVHVNLGTPVSQSQLPGGCGNNGNHIGVNSTPVIDLASQTLYVMAYVSSSGVPNFHLHALNLTTLTDKIAPITVAASHTLSDGSTEYAFTPGSSRQRSALLEADGNLYAGFASFCDINANTSRGWLLGWNAATLAPVTTQLNNQVLPANSPNHFFLSSIWMSGSGPAADGAGNLYFVTGNSDPSGTTYDNTNDVNLSESVVQWSTASNSIASFFSPTDRGAAVSTLDVEDEDFGSGGVVLLPPQPGSGPPLAVAAGKAGILYLLDATGLGGENSGAALGEYAIGGCWCEPSYFKGSDGVGRVVSSGGNTVQVWKVQTASTPSLVADPNFTPPSIPASLQDPGFFTSVSSNGTAAGSAIIWAVGRPFDNTNDVTLYAFNASTGAQLYSGAAGTWPNTGGNANLVPTVANGRVYVASFKSLAIFGVGAAGPTTAAAEVEIARTTRPAIAATASQVTGVVRSIDGARVVIGTGDGKLVTADLTDAIRLHAAVKPRVGQPALVHGTYDDGGVLIATSFLHAKAQAVLEAPDR